MKEVYEAYIKHNDECIDILLAKGAKKGISPSDAELMHYLLENCKHLKEKMRGMNPAADAYAKTDNPY